MHIHPVTLGAITIGDGGAPALIAGPCVVESREMCLDIASRAKEAANKAGMAYVFKASFDKANRTSATSFRGVGMDAALDVLAAVRDTVDVPVLTDVHETWQCEPVAAVCDVLQIPAFLSRQTDLLVAAARTGRAVNVKKGQFLAPDDMRNVVQKVTAEGNVDVLLTERGSSFGYHTLVVDMTGLPIMRALGYPVIFDGTHSVQTPGADAGGTRSGGHREFVAHLCRAATAVGIDGLFLEVHPRPDAAPSDAASMLPISSLESLLNQVAAIDAALRRTPSDERDQP